VGVVFCLLLAVFQLILGSACNMLEEINMSMMRGFDTAIQVTETIDSQFVANIQYKVRLSAS